MKKIEISWTELIFRFFAATTVMVEGMWIGLILERMWPAVSQGAAGQWYSLPLLATYLIIGFGITAIGFTMLPFNYKAIDKNSKARKLRQRPAIGLNQSVGNRPAIRRNNKRKERL